MRFIFGGLLIFSPPSIGDVAGRGDGRFSNVRELESGLPRSQSAN